VVLYVTWIRVAALLVFTVLVGNIANGKMHNLKVYDEDNYFEKVMRLLDSRLLAKRGFIYCKLRKVKKQ
jgi:hypothetical protein